MNEPYVKVLQSALITPLLKKADLVSGDPPSYRPTPNLLVVSKLLQRTVFWQLHDYLLKSGLLPRLQSAYLAEHPIETALTDILYAMDDGDVSVLALLDLSAVVSARRRRFRWLSTESG
jgi:hypothetical protein